MMHVSCAAAAPRDCYRPAALQGQLEQGLQGKVNIYIDARIGARKGLSQPLTVTGACAYEQF